MNALNSKVKMLHHATGCQKATHTQFNLIFVQLHSSITHMPPFSFVPKADSSFFFSSFKQGSYICFFSQISCSKCRVGKLSIKMGIAVIGGH